MVLNLASNLASLRVFIPLGATWSTVGLAMAGAQITGASIGASLAVRIWGRIGGQLILPLLVIVLAGMALRLLWQALA